MELFRSHSVSRDAWQSLVHVCRRWRHIVFASPHYLNLRLHCTNNTPVRKTLDIWPAFPIVVLCHNTNSSSPLRGVLNIIAALKCYNRVCEINFSGIPDSLLKRFAALTIPFPALTSLQLHSNEDWPYWPLILPSSFLGGFAPRLRSLRLNGIAFPAPQKLFSSCTGLATLRMENIPRTGYISPDDMATCLSALAKVEEVALGFRWDQLHYPWFQTSPNQPSPTCAVLPSLTSLRFRGDSWYLETLISQIDVPLLDNFDITFFDLTLSNTPLLCELISRMETFKGLHRAKVAFRDYIADITFSRQEPSADCKTLKLGIACGRPAQQLSSMTRICSSSLPPLSTLTHLYIHDSYWLTHSPDEMVNAQWLELLLPFTSVENLHLCHKQAPYVTRALQELTGERIVQVLPALQTIFLHRPPLSGADPEVTGRFIAARQLSGRPVSVHYAYGIGW